MKLLLIDLRRIDVTLKSRTKMAICFLVAERKTTKSPKRVTVGFLMLLLRMTNVRLTA